MDLSEIMDIQDGLLEKKADLFLNYKPTNSVTPKTMRRKKDLPFTQP